MPSWMGLQWQRTDLQGDKKGQHEVVRQGETIRPAKKLLAFVLSLQTLGRGARDSRWNRAAASWALQGLHRLLFWGHCNFNETLAWKSLQFGFFC